MWGVNYFWDNTSCGDASEILVANWIATEITFRMMMN